MNNVIINTETRVHLDSVDPKIRIYNQEKDTYLPDRSFLTVDYEDGHVNGSKVVLYLDHPAAKALAEGILAKLPEMKHRD